jgi:hypothetical protein
MLNNLTRKTTLEVVKQAKSVRINREKILELAKKWAKENIKVPRRPVEDILDTKNERKILDYLIILDTLNFCFWSQREKWNIKYKGKKYDGYFAMSLCLKKFFEEKPEQAEFKNLAKISYKDFCDIFKGKPACHGLRHQVLPGGGELQFLRKRWPGARSVSRALLKKYNGDSRKFIASAKHKFSILVPKIYKELPTFGDTAKYNGKKVYLLKRAQILAADICFAFGNKGIGRFDDLNYLTSMPDYKLPQILRHWGILAYSRELENKIRNRILIHASSKEEVEIRGATVWAVEYLKDELLKFGKKFHAYEIDWILWIKSQEENIKNPYHLTKTIFY